MNNILHLTSTLKILILLELAVGSYSQERQNGIVRRYHDNGSVAAEINYKNGKKDGLFKNWYDNGQVHETGIFSNDSLVGYLMIYYPDGKRSSESYRNDQHELHGLSLNWYQNGVLQDSGMYVHGRRHGEWRRHFKNGQLQFIKHYNLGTVNGKCVFFDEQGDTTRIEILQDGKKVRVKQY
jgi:antitoxin component YwqK of YwqJK toxin-antitoxin module